MSAFRSAFEAPKESLSKPTCSSYIIVSFSSNSMYWSWASKASVKKLNVKFFEIKIKNMTCRIGIWFYSVNVLSQTNDHSRFTYLSIVLHRQERIFSVLVVCFLYVVLLLNHQPAEQSKLDRYLTSYEVSRSLLVLHPILPMCQLAFVCISCFKKYSTYGKHKRTNENKQISEI